MNMIALLEKMATTHPADPSLATLVDAQPDMVQQAFKTNDVTLLKQLLDHNHLLADRTTVVRIRT